MWHGSGTQDAGSLSDHSLVMSSGLLTCRFLGAACRNRTDDLFITSEPLCRLS